MTSAPFSHIYFPLLRSLPINLPLHPLDPLLGIFLRPRRLLPYSHLLMLFLLLNPLFQLGLSRGVALAGLIRVR